jgi:hypothetical protein
LRVKEKAAGFEELAVWPKKGACLRLGAKVKIRASQQLVRLEPIIGPRVKRCKLI